MSAKIADIHAIDFEREVVNSDKLVVVDFWAEWCGPCKMISPRLAEVASELPDKVKLAKVDVDAEPQLAQQFGISNIPTLLFIKGGKVVEQPVGAVGKKVIVTKINAHA
jgi:thioredoxin